MHTAFNNGADQRFEIDRANLTISLKSLIDSLPAAVSDKVLGACVYEFINRDTMVMVANAEGAQSCPSHHAFLNNKLIGAQIHVPRTSVHKSLYLDKAASVQPSGFSANHQCVNVVLDNAGRFDKTVVQLALKEKGQGSLHLSAQEQDAVTVHMLNAMNGAGIRDLSATFNQNYAAHLMHYMNPHAMKPREGFMVYSDIRGSSAVENALMHPQTYTYLQTYREELGQIFGAHYGDRIRGYGDDLWMMFPASEMDTAERTQLLQTNILPAIKEAKHWYNGFTTQFNSAAIKKTHLKFALSYGSHIAIPDQQGGYSHEGKPFYKVQALMGYMKSHTKRGFVAFDETVEPYLRGGDMRYDEKIVGDRAHDTKMASIRNAYVHSPF